MALRIGPSFVPVTRTENESFSPEPRPAVAPAASNEIFADGFNNAVRAPVNLGTPQPATLPETALSSTALPSFKIGAGRAFAAPSFANEETSTQEENPLESIGERYEQGEAIAEGLNGLRDDAEANRADIEGTEGTLGERAGQLLEDIPGAAKFGELLESTPVQGLGIGAGAVGSYFEGERLLENGDDLGSAEAGALGNFAVGTVPGTQGLAAFDTLSKLGVELVSGDNSEEPGDIYGRGVFTDTAVDGARALEGLGEAAFTGDTSGLDNFRDSVDNGSLFERALGTVGNLIGATGAAIATGSTEPFSEFADDTSRAFSTLGQPPAKTPAAAPTPSEDLSNPFDNYETPAPNTTEIPSYELNAPDLGFGPSYGQDFVPDYTGGESGGDFGDFGGGGGGGGGGFTGEETASEE